MCLRARELCRNPPALRLAQHAEVLQASPQTGQTTQMNTEPSQAFVLPILDPNANKDQVQRTNSLNTHTFAIT